MGFFNIIRCILIIGLVTARTPPDGVNDVERNITTDAVIASANADYVAGSEFTPSFEAYKVYPYTYPDLKKCTSDPHPISPLQLVCPRHLNELKPASGSLTHCKVNEGSLNHISVPGNLVHKVVYTTYCSRSFFMQDTIVQTITEEIIFPSDVLQLDLTSLISPYFPAPNCIWLTEKNAASRTFLVTNSLATQVDPYSLEYIDQHLLTGKCQTSPCLTNWKNTLWIPSDIPNPECGHWKGVEMNIHYDAGKRPTFGSAIGHHPWGFKDACMLTFCGIPVIRTRSGEPVICHNMRFTNCPVGSSVQLRGHEDDNLYLTEEEWSKELRLNCLEALTEIRGSNRITQLQMSYFRQQHEGYGPVYRLSNGTLSVQTCYYKGVISIKDSGSKLILTDDTSTNVKIDAFGQGVNGIYKNAQGEIIIPDYELLEEIYDLEMMNHLEIKTVRHPTLLVLNVTDQVQVNLHKSNTVDLSKLELPAIGSIIGGITGSIMGVVLLVVLLYCLCCVTSLSCKIPTSKPKSERENLRQRRSPVGQEMSTWA